MMIQDFLELPLLAKAILITVWGLTLYFGPKTMIEDARSAKTAE